MRGGALPPALLCAALAFALAFAPRRAVLPAVAALVVAGLAVVFAPVPKAWQEAVFAGCWISIIVTAASVHLPRGLALVPAVALGVNAGIWAGAVVALGGVPLDLARALLAALLVLPAAWLVAHRGAIAVKVVSSWLVAVAILAATLPIVQTPGYVPDHME